MQNQSQPHYTIGECKIFLVSAQLPKAIQGSSGEAHQLETQLSEATSWPSFLCNQGMDYVTKVWRRT